MTAADAPSIYDIPKVLHREGLDAYVVRRLDLPFRDVDWTLWDDLLRRVHHPSEEVTVALVGKYIDLPDAYLSVAEALRAGGFAHDARVNVAGSPPTTARPRGRRQAARRRRRGLRPRRLRRPRHRGQARRAELRPRARHPDARPVPGPAVHGDRVRPQRGRPGEGRLHRVRPRVPGAGDRDHGRAARVVEGAGDLGGTMRLGLYPADLLEGSVVRAGLRRRPGRGAAPAPLRGQQRLPRPARGGRAGVLRHCRRTATWSSSSSCPATCTRTTSPPRPTPSSAPARPARTRCSRGWSARRSTASASSGSRSTSPGCAARPPTTTRADGHRRGRPARRAGRVARRPSTDLYRGDWVLGAARRHPERHRRVRTSSSTATSSSYPVRSIVLAVDDRRAGGRAAPVPARGPDPAGRAARRAPRRTRGRTRWSRPSVSCARSRAGGRQLDAPGDECCRRRGSAPRRTRSTWPAGCTSTDRDGFEPEHEEAEMSVDRVPIDGPARRRCWRAGCATLRWSTAVLAYDVLSHGAEGAAPSESGHGERASRRTRSATVRPARSSGEGRRPEGSQEPRVPGGDHARSGCTSSVAHGHEVVVERGRRRRARRSPTRSTSRPGPRSSTRPTTSGPTPTWCSRSRSRSPRSTTGCGRGWCCSPTCTWPPTGR